MSDPSKEPQCDNCGRIPEVEMWQGFPRLDTDGWMLNIYQDKEWTTLCSGCLREMFQKARQQREEQHG